jgi:hypothetical protein
VTQDTTVMPVVSQSQRSTRTQSYKDVLKDPTRHSVLGKRSRGESESEEEEELEVEMISSHKLVDDVSKNNFTF